MSIKDRLGHVRPSKQDDSSRDEPINISQRRPSKDSAQHKTYNAACLPTRFPSPSQSVFADVRETERLWKGCDSIARTADRAAARREKDLVVARVTAEFIFIKKKK